MSRSRKSLVDGEKSEMPNKTNSAYAECRAADLRR